MNGLPRCPIPASLTALCLLLATPLGAATIRVPAEQPTIQAGLDAASPEDTVLVAPGTYAGPGNRDLDYGGKDLTLLSEGGAQVTTIDCQQLGRGLYFRGGETRDAVIEGFTIRNGLPGGPESRGGAILCALASPTIRGNVIRDCQATAGGGIFLIVSAAEIIENTISDNACQISQEGGGGVACVQSSTPRIAGNTIIRNSATVAGGGGVFLSRSPAVITENLISDNESAEGGGGIVCVDRADATILRNTIIENSASAGGGIAFAASGPTIADNLICRNESTQGGGIFCNSTSTGTIEGNTIVENWGTGIYFINASSAAQRNIIAFSTQGYAVRCVQGSSPGLSCNDLFGNQLGDELCGIDLGGNFSADPLFCDRANGDYTLFEDSPCLPGQHPGGANCGLVGALGQGCGATAVEPTTWGAIKAAGFLENLPARSSALPPDLP